MSRPVLYHYPASFSSQIVRLALVEKGVKWRSRKIDIIGAFDHYKPKYMALNPNGVVPTLVHDEKEIIDSIAIAIYINNHFPGPHLIPTDERGRALMEQWVNLQQHFPERELMYSMMSGTRASFAAQDIERRKRVLQEAAKKHEDLAAYYEDKYDDIVSLDRVLGNESVAHKHIETFRSMIDMIEEVLRKNTWLAGEDYSLADVVWTVFLARLDMLGLKEVWEDGHHPFVTGYYETVKARPSFKKAKIYNRIPVSSYVDAVIGRIPGARLAMKAILILIAGFAIAQLLKVIFLLIT